MLARLTDRNYCGAQPMIPFDRKTRLRCPQTLLVLKRRLPKNKGWRIRQPQCYFGFDLAFLRPLSPSPQPRLPALPRLL